MLGGALLAWHQTQKKETCGPSEPKSKLREVMTAGNTEHDEKIFTTPSQRIGSPPCAQTLWKGVFEKGTQRPQESSLGYFPSRSEASIVSFLFLLRSYLAMLRGNSWL